MGDNKSIKSNKTKFLLSIISIIIILLIIISIYFFNKSFRDKIDILLAKLPGNVGEYFTPSDNLEGGDIETYLANYYTSLEPELAAHKLYIIKKDNGKIYSGIIKAMNSANSSKTETIIKLLRKIEDTSGSLAAIYNAIQHEKKELVLSEASKLENQDLLITINEIEARIENDEIFKDGLAKIMNNINDDRVADILYYIEDSIKDKILYSLENNKKVKVENKLLIKKAQNSKLKSLASLYESKPLDVSLDEIGGTQEYNITELGIIYTNLPILKTAEILSQLDDDKFIEELYSAIRNEEELNKIEDSVTNYIGESIQFITEYNRKIDNLISVYEKMNANKVAKIVEKMILNKNTTTILEINSEPIFEISDSSIIIDVLSRMRNKSLSDIMNHMNPDKVSILTQMLVDS